MQMFASLPLQGPHLLQQQIANYTKVKKILGVSNLYISASIYQQKNCKHRSGKKTNQYIISTYMNNVLTVST